MKAIDSVGGVQPESYHTTHFKKGFMEMKHYLDSGREDLAQQAADALAGLMSDYPNYKQSTLSEPLI